MCNASSPVTLTEKLTDIVSVKTALVASQSYIPLSVFTTSLTIKMLRVTDPLEPLASKLCEILLLELVGTFLTTSGVLNNHLIFAGGLAVTLHSMIRVSISSGALLLPSMCRLGGTAESLYEMEYIGTKINTGCYYKLPNTSRLLSVCIMSLPPVTMHV